LIIFDSSSKIKLREFDSFSLRASKLAGVYLFFNFIFLSVATHFLFRISWGLSIVFALIMSGTSPEVMLSLLGASKHKAVEILKLESIINTPLTVLLPFIAIDIIRRVTPEEGISSTIIAQLAPFLTKFVAGIGAGVLVGIILFKAMKRKYSPIYSQLAVIIAALLTYVMAEKLGGSGVLAVTTLGLFFGNLALRKGKSKKELLQFESLLTKALFILVFVLVGLIIKIPLDKQFLINAGILFLIAIVIRYLAISVSFRGKKEIDTKAKVFMTLSATKGIPVAVVVFTLAIYNVPGTALYLPGMSTVLDLALLFLLATIILSSIVVKFSKFFIKEEIKEQD
jgi:NhaP-type Na+/H+ or K+/H+ antiporter